MPNQDTEFSVKAVDIPLPEVPQPDPNELAIDSYKALTPIQQRFVHLYIGGTAKSLAELARVLQVSKVTVQNWMMNSNVKRAIREYQDQEHEMVTAGLKAMRMKALLKMGELMDSKVDGIAYQACRDVLDRTGNKAVDKKEVDVNVKQTFEQQIVALMQGRKKEEPEIIEVEGREV